MSGSSIFRFSIRELFLLTLVIAMAFGWLVDHFGYAPTRREIDYLRWKAESLKRVLEDYDYTVEEDNESLIVKKDGPGYGVHNFDRTMPPQVPFWRR